MLSEELSLSLISVLVFILGCRGWSIWSLSIVVGAITRTWWWSIPTRIRLIEIRALAWVLLVWHTSTLHHVIATIESILTKHPVTTSLARGGHGECRILWWHNVTTWEVSHSKHLRLFTFRSNTATYASSLARWYIPSRFCISVLLLKAPFLISWDRPLFVSVLTDLFLVSLNLVYFLFNLTLCLIVDLRQVCANRVVNTKVGRREVSCHLVARHRFMVHMHKLLLNSQVMIGNG